MLNEKLDLHRSFAGEYGVTEADLVETRKLPTCEAYTSFLVRTAYDRPVPVTVAALFPCMRGYLDVAEHVAERAEAEHRYTPFIETYTAEEFRAETASVRGLVDRLAASHPGTRDAMREVFLTSARLELALWEMAYAGEEWSTRTPPGAAERGSDT